MMCNIKIEWRLYLDEHKDYLMLLVYITRLYKESYACSAVRNHAEKVIRALPNVFEGPTAKVNFSF
jgi:hypothetical protein